jgi:hypothetical protein
MESILIALLTHCLFMRIIFLMALLIMMTSGCSKKEEVSCIAGTGGTHSLLIRFLKEGAPYVSQSSGRVMVYIAFEETDVPGFDSSSFDLIRQADDNADFIRIANLTCGIYYCKLKMTEQATGKSFAGSQVISIKSDHSEKEVTINMALLP